MLTRRMTEPPPMTRLRDEMGRLFDRFFAGYEPLRAWEPFALRRFPAVNAWQDDDNVFIEAELPGLTEKDIELSVMGNELTLKGERPAVEPTEGTTVLRSERGSGTFSRVVHLPVDVDDAKVEATFRNGVLTVTLPKAEVAKSRRIPVRELSV